MLLAANITFFPDLPAECGLNVSTMLAWAVSMTWKGFHPIIQLNSKIYQKGISLNKLAMKEIEKRLERNPLLPKWDILIRPA